EEKEKAERSLTKSVQKKRSQQHPPATKVAGNRIKAARHRRQSASTSDASSYDANNNKHDREYDDQYTGDGEDGDEHADEEPNEESKEELDEEPGSCIDLSDLSEDKAAIAREILPDESLDASFVAKDISPKTKRAVVERLSSKLLTRCVPLNRRQRRAHRRLRSIVDKMFDNYKKYSNGIHWSIQFWFDFIMAEELVQ
ncbi:hypothetical protein OHC33_007027, partial [Knufia fluminis]